MDGLDTFLRDNHNLHCTGDHTAFVKMNAMQNNEALDNYFRELKHIIDEH